MTIVDILLIDEDILVNEEESAMTEEKKVVNEEKSAVTGGEINVTNKDFLSQLLPFFRGFVGFVGPVLLTAAGGKRWHGRGVGFRISCFILIRVNSCNSWAVFS